MPDNKERNFFVGLFYELDGSPSFAKFVTAIVLESVIVWVSYFVFAKGIIPDLSGISLFSGTVLGLTYGVNKVSQAVSTSITGKQP